MTCLMGFVHNHAGDESWRRSIYCCHKNSRKYYRIVFWSIRTCKENYVRVFYLGQISRLGPAVIETLWVLPHLGFGMPPLLQNVADQHDWRYTPFKDEQRLRRFDFTIWCLCLTKKNRSLHSSR
jgi:hypothetical protein